jgi:hypothetical protein
MQMYLDAAFLQVRDGRRVLFLHFLPAWDHHRRCQFIYLFQDKRVFEVACKRSTRRTNGP